jgi:hypothetical protein
MLIGDHDYALLIIVISPIDIFRSKISLHARIQRAKRVEAIQTPA